LFSKTANPELPALIGQGGLPGGESGRRQGEALEQVRH
jgi:hypothetical protein